MNVEAVSGNNKNIFLIGNSDSPSTVHIKIYGNKYRSLVDTGAACSLVHKNVYESLQIKPKLSKSNASLKSVKGGQLNVLGSISLPFILGGMRMNHPFIVAFGINKNVILGKDWLSKFGV